MSWKWKYSSVLVAVTLTLCAPIFGPTGTTTTVGTGSGGYEAVFGTSAGVGNDICLRAEALSNAAGAICTNATTHIIALHTLALHTGEIPKMTRFTCFITQAGNGIDAGEAWTLTPTWVQGDGAGALNTDAGANTLTCTGSASASGPCEFLGDSFSTNTEDTSPYSGPQALRVNASKGGATFNTPAITCQIRIEIT